MIHGVVFKYFFVLFMKLFFDFCWWTHWLRCFLIEIHPASYITADSRCIQWVLMFAEALWNGFKLPKGKFVHFQWWPLLIKLIFQFNQFEFFFLLLAMDKNCAEVFPSWIRKVVWIEFWKKNIAVSGNLNPLKVIKNKTTFNWNFQPHFKLWKDLLVFTLTWIVILHNVLILKPGM